MSLNKKKNDQVYIYTEARGLDNWQALSLKEIMESFWPKKLSHWRNKNSTRDSD